MNPKSKPWIITAAIGQGVLFSLALVGAVRLTYRLCGVPLPESVAGKLFILSSVVAGGVAGAVCVRYLKRQEQPE